MLQTKISDLKARLSSYVARARRGETVLILDRQTPVAQLGPIDVHKGLIVYGPTESAKSLRNHRSPVRLKKPVDVVALLREDRDQR